MRAIVIASLGAFSILAVGVAVQAQPLRPPITSVSHLSVYDGDPAKAERFYVHDLGAVKGTDPENPQGARYYFSPTQFVEVLPLPVSAGANRMDHIAFNTANAEAMRKAANIRSLSIAGLIAEAITRTAAEESVSSLFD